MKDPIAIQASITRLPLAHMGGLAVSILICVFWMLGYNLEILWTETTALIIYEYLPSHMVI